MKLKPSTKHKIYDWDDIQERICELMKIDEKHFRNYHEVVGGEYKDLWHVWLDITYKITNDHACPFWFSEVEDNHVIERLTKQYGDWIVKFLDCLKEIKKEIVDEIGTDRVLIYYSW